jgi:hypothetical protein
MARRQANSTANAELSPNITEPSPNRTPNGTPNHAPKTTPNRTPKSAPKSGPITGANRAPKSAPKTRPNAAPKVTPAVVAAPPAPPLVEVFPVHDFHLHHSTSPHRFGERVGEFVTADDAKAYLKSHGLCGHFAFVERHNGRIGQTWHVEIEPPEWAGDEEDADLIDMEEGEEELSPSLMRLHLENARLKARLEHQPSAQSSMLETVQALRMLNELRGPQQQPRSLVEQIREAKELLTVIAPKPAPPPPEAAPPSDPTTAVIKMLIEDPDGMGKLRSQVSSLFAGQAPEERGMTWQETLLGMWESAAPFLLPALTPYIPQLVEKFTGAKLPSADGAATSATATQGGQAAATAQTPESGPGEQEYAQTLRLLAETMAANGDPQPVAAAIRTLADGGPQFAPLPAWLLQRSPKAVLAELAEAAPDLKAMTELPHAVRWVERLQTELEQLPGLAAGAGGPG